MRFRIKNSLSYLLIAVGTFILFQGAREYLGSRIGQIEGAREFQEERPSASAAGPEVQPPRPGGTFARLLIPRLDAELYVVEGDEAAELRRGPGHLTGTAMPGAAGNCIIAGHRDTHFRILKDIRDGDDIVLQTAAGEYLYRVRETRIVSPANTSVLEPTSDAELRLITCYPFYYVGSAPKRFVVAARLAGAIRGTS